MNDKYKEIDTRLKALDSRLSKVEELLIILSGERIRKLLDDLDEAKNLLKERNINK